MAVCSAFEFRPSNLNGNVMKDYTRVCRIRDVIVNVIFIPMPAKQNGVEVLEGHLMKNLCIYA